MATKNKKEKRKSNKEIRHDLKTPIAVISGYAQLLLQKYEGTDTKEEKWGKVMYQEINRLVDMINTLLSDELE